MQGTRLRYLDVYKGILMLMVIYGHIVYAIALYADGYTNATYQWFQTVANDWVAPYYMAAFFIVTGYCMFRTKPFKKQIIDDLRRLIVPGLIMPVLLLPLSLSDFDFSDFLKKIFLHGGGYWFIIALFISKLQYSLLCKWVRSPLRWFILAASMMLGSYFVENKIFEIWSLYHAMVMIIFLEVGSALRKYDLLNRRLALIGAVSLALYLLLTLVYHMIGWGMPAFCAIQTYYWKLVFMYFLFAVSGSMVLLWAAKWIEHCHWLEYVGKNSLIYYLVHFSFFGLFIPWIKDYVVY